MITMAQLAAKYEVSKTYIRKLYKQKRLRTRDGKIAKPTLAGNVLLFPDDTRIPKARAAYGSLTKSQRDPWHTSSKVNKT